MRFFNVVVPFGIMLMAGCADRVHPVTWVSTTNTDRWVTHKDVKVSPDDGTVAYAVTVNLKTTYQTIDGFGGCFNEKGWIALQQLSAADRNAVIKSLFDPQEGCGFSICRMPIGASDFAMDYYSLNDTKDDYGMRDFSIARDRRCLIPYIKSAMAVNPKLKIWGSPWCPPAWMKVSGRYGTPNKTEDGYAIRWEPKVLAAYALYLAKYVQAYRREGIDVYAVHVQNEPHSEQVFPCCTWPGEHLRDFIRDYLGPRLQSDGVKAEIWLGTLGGGSVQSGPGLVLSDPKARAYITGVGLQWVGKTILRPTHEAFPDVKLMQTETECGDGKNSWHDGVYTYGLMQLYLSNFANSYMYWNMVLDETGESSWQWKQNAMITVDTARKTVTYNPEFYVMKHYSAFIAPGAKRIGLAGVEGLAFSNPDGSIVLVTANMKNKPAPISIKTGSRIIQITLPPGSINTVAF